jgi:hypothetical protein
MPSAATNSTPRNESNEYRSAASKQKPVVATMGDEWETKSCDKDHCRVANGAQRASTMREMHEAWFKGRHMEETMSIR